MAKQLLFDDRARIKLQRGVKILADAVAVTMGPTGRNVIIDKSFGNPLVTKDGVTVSKEVELEDPYEHMGAKLVNEVASKTSDIAGDGTTTATVLARAIYDEGLRSITLGSNPMVVRRGIDKAVEAAVEHIQKASKPVSSKAEIAQVGSISANNDQTIGNLIADAMERVGTRRRDHGRRGQRGRDHARIRRRDAVRQGVYFSLFRQQSPEHDVRAGKLPDPDPREEDFQPPRFRSCAGKSGPFGQTASGHLPKTSRGKPSRPSSSTGCAAC